MVFLVSTRCTEATMQWPKKSGSLDAPANTQEEFGPDGLHGSIFGATLVSPTMCIERSTFFSFCSISVLSRWQTMPIVCSSTFFLLSAGGLNAVIC